MLETLAAVASAAHAPMEWVPVLLDDPRPDEVLVEVMAVGICHSDLNGRDQHLPIPLPAVLGHEGAGIVRAVGAEVTTVRVGDHVVMSQAFCGWCPECQAGRVTSCDNTTRLAFGGRRADGTSSIKDAAGNDLSSGFLGQSSLARFAIARAVNAVVIPEDVPWEIAAPLGCGVQTGAGTVFNVVKPAPDKSLVVFGAGTVGLSAVLAAVHAGLTSVTVVDTNPGRLELAAELGATATVDATDPGLVERLRSLTGGGADYVIEASGAVAAGPPAVESLKRKGGTCVLVGAPPFGTKLTVDWIGVVSGRTITGCTYGGAHPAHSIGRLLEMRAAGALPLDRLVRTYGFADLERAIADMESGEVVKPVLLA
jgi:aryl-alcohol dehydrogenase